MRPEYERVGLNLETESPYDTDYFHRADEAIEILEALARPPS